MGDASRDTRTRSSSSSKGSMTTNGAHDETSDEAEPRDEAGDDADGTWLPASELARMMGISAAAVTKLGESGEIQRKRESSHRSWLYLMPRPIRAERDVTVAQLRLALKEAHAATAAAYRLVTEPAFKMLELFSMTNTKQQAAIETLTGAQTGWIAAREEALNLAHVRDLDTALAMKKQARWDAAFETLAKNAPALGGQLLETVAAWVMGKRGEEALELLRSLEHLADDASIAPDVRERLRDLLKKTAPPNPAAAADDATTSSSSSTEGSTDGVSA